MSGSGRSGRSSLLGLGVANSGAGVAESGVGAAESGAEAAEAAEKQGRIGGGTIKVAEGYWLFYLLLFPPTVAPINHKSPITFSEAPDPLKRLRSGQIGAPIKH